MTVKEFEIQYALGSLSRKLKLELAFSKRTSKTILGILSKDRKWIVKYWIACNTNTPTKILKKLDASSDGLIHATAYQTLRKVLND